jgi:hypothetical protein
MMGLIYAFLACERSRLQLNGVVWWELEEEWMNAPS